MRPAVRSGGPGRATPSPAATELARLRVSAGLDAGGHGLSARTDRMVEVARAVGAPVLTALDAALTAERDVQRAARAVSVATAQTRLVAGGLLLAPFLLVPALGRLLDADLVTFYRTTSGLVVLAVGGSLLLCGAGMVAVLIRRVGPSPRIRSHLRTRVLAGLLALTGWMVGGPIGGIGALLLASNVLRGSDRPVDVPGVEEAADLVATARGGGLTTAESLRVAADHLPGLAVRLRRLAFNVDRGAAGDPVLEAQSDSFERLVTVLVTAHELGAPVAPSLRRLAADLRADELARVLAAAERLPAQLTFPTALCLLPGTVLLVGAPIVQVGLVAAGT